MKPKKPHYFDPKIHELVSLWLGDYAQQKKMTREQLALLLDSDRRTINRLLNIRLVKMVSVYRLMKWLEVLGYELEVKIVPKKVANDNKLAAAIH